MHYKSPRISVDGIIRQQDRILLIKRKYQPFKERWALPGGFVNYGETVEDAVIREVLEETGLYTEIKGLIGVYSDPKRDPRGHTITIVFQLKPKRGNIKSGDDAADAKYFDLKDLPCLAFDHNLIIDNSILRN
jgi:8-oxo-dGTP diphosphatase